MNEVASKQAIPMMSHDPFFVERAGIASYSASAHELGRQAARLVDKILKGAKPADLPVEQPTTFELVINLKNAKALGITIPQSVLVRATRLIKNYVEARPRRRARPASTPVWRPRRSPPCR